MANEPQIAPYGTWTSPITVELLSSGSIYFSGMEVNKSSGQVYVGECRPAEGGRCCIVELRDGRSRDVLPKPYSAMSTVHEYGGGSFAIHPRDGSLIFTDAPTNGIFALDPESTTVTSIVKPSPDLRFADFDVHPQDAWILSVKEDHSCTPVENSVVAVDATTGEAFVVANGADFYAHPKFSPDGRSICWVEWSHPDMPWTGSVLYTAKWQPRERAAGTVIAGQAKVESICQPRWSPSGDLFFVSDKTGYWQLYRLDTGSTKPHLISLKGLETSEFGWRESVLGHHTYDFLTPTTIIAAVTKDATSSLVVIDTLKETYFDVPLDVVAIQKTAIRALTPTTFIVLGTTATTPQAVYHASTDPPTKTLLKPSITLALSPSIFSSSTHLTFRTAHGPSHAIFLPPHNPSFTAPPSTLPPLIVYMHGGPTLNITPALDLNTQYWTSRGYAYVSVNHAGSTGYGRAYRSLLHSNWGVLDIADAVSCIEHLSSQRLIDSTRVGIVGESAGGYAVLQALTTYPSVFRAGVSLYGVSNLAALTAAMHKFESQYVQYLVLEEGMSEEEVRTRYWERSACFHADRIEAPLLLLQGNVDTVVPEEQTREMERVMRKLGREVEVVVYEGEGHGWQMETTIKASIEKQDEFWAKTLLK